MLTYKMNVRRRWKESEGVEVGRWLRDDVWQPRPKILKLGVSRACVSSHDQQSIPKQSPPLRLLLNIK